MASFSDTFNRANGAPGANYTTLQGTVTIVSNALTASVSPSTAQWNANTFTRNSYVEFTLSAAPTTTNAFGLFLLDGSFNGYAFYINGTQGSIYRDDASVLSAALGTASFTPSSGDVFHMSRVGSIVVLERNRVQVLSVTDATYLTGTISAFIDYQSTQPSISAWAGGDIDLLMSQASF